MEVKPLETPPNLPEMKRRSLTPNPTTASPPPPRRMERGVDSIVCKQRGRFFNVKRRPFHCKETPSSNGEGRSFHFKILLPLYLSGIGVHVNGSIHAPLHSERGKGVRLQSRDRRPRLETPPSLPQGEECLMVTYLNGSFYPKGCHRVGTDALVCPHKEDCL